MSTLNPALSGKRVFWILLIAIPIAALLAFLYDGSAANATVNKGLERITGVSVKP